MRRRLRGAARDHMYSNAQVRLGGWRRRAPRVRNLHARDRVRERLLIQITVQQGPSWILHSVSDWTEDSDAEILRVSQGHQDPGPRQVNY